MYLKFDVIILTAFIQRYQHPSTNAQSFIVDGPPIMFNQNKDRLYVCLYIRGGKVKMAGGEDR